MLLRLRLSWEAHSLYQNEKQEGDPKREEEAGRLCRAHHARSLVSRPKNGGEAVTTSQAAAVSSGEQCSRGTQGAVVVEVGEGEVSGAGGIAPSLNRFPTLHRGRESACAQRSAR